MQQELTATDGKIVCYARYRANRKIRPLDIENRQPDISRKGYLPGAKKHYPFRK
ncbi:hypothetical protein [Pseudomonas sp. EYE_354]|uniref:hypothetical protein n=1 Tax=Pseudomonas sp. EYE_354 TaxID=2853449 RepID=UPI002004F3D7|nr:hypothetical protein [Pseudomonas sp. EYE_354]MCK6186768.1 hypothetical protein [Pseudomonas sp. EYE_354]